MTDLQVQSKPERLFYIDNIRLLVIIFVVTVHMACMYSGLPIFYYSEAKRISALGLFYIEFQQAYFMGLLFLLSGYFVGDSYDKKGLGRFIGDRAIRLLIPTLIYMVILMPIVQYAELGKAFSFYLRRFLVSYGVMWFAVALFIFSAVYAVVRKSGRSRNTVNNVTDGNLTRGKLWALILLITICAFVIRLFFKLGTAQFGMELCYFASYIILFIAGTYAKKHDTFSQISYKNGKRWLTAGIVVGVFGWAILMILGLLTGKAVSLPVVSGIYNAAYALWESFTGVAICTGLIGVFKEKFNKQNNLIKAMAGSSFTVYVIHAPIIVGVAVLAGPIAIPLLLKWVIMCVICVPICFAVAYFIRKIPLLNKIL